MRSIRRLTWKKKRLKEKGVNIFVIQPATAKILAFFWNMLAIAQNKLDDYSFISENNDIGSIPLTGLPKSAEKRNNTKAKRSNDSKQTDAEKVAVNGSAGE